MAERYERRDLGLRYLALGAAVLGLFAAIVSLLAGGLFAVFLDWRAAENPPARPAAVVPPVIVGPRLQEDPVGDLRRWREQESRMTESYGWVDDSRRMARIPVERAMELILENGLLPVETKP